LNPPQLFFQSHNTLSNYVQKGQLYTVYIWFASHYFVRSPTVEKFNPSS